MRGKKLDVDRTKHDVERSAKLATGGRDRMFKQQAAGPATPARTGKAQNPAPGAASAQGGKGGRQAVEYAKGQKVKPAAGGVSRPARPGVTGC